MAYTFVSDRYNRQNTVDDEVKKKISEKKAYLGELFKNPPIYECPPVRFKSEGR